ncbi:MAG TPA: MATE family efflux transporter [Gemmatimonadales bacterium]|nr:MATE family efflux transporter [Gemmatimonadales bacterium]
MSAPVTSTRATGALTTGPLRPMILRLAIPAVAMMACHFTFGLIDAMWVGRLIGPAALAAVSTAGFYIWILLSLGEMVEVGLVAVAARRHGEGHPERAARVAAAAVLYAVATGIVVSGVGLAITGFMFRFMGVPTEVAGLGRQYLSTWLLGGPLVFGFFAIEATFRASGDTRTPMVLLGSSALLSLALDPLLIAGLGPFPRLGVEGAALASVMVRGGGFVIGVVIAFRRGLIRLDTPDWRAVPTLLRIGAPLSLAGVLLSIIYIWLTRFTAQFGTPALASLGIGHKIEGLGFIAISGLGLSAAALVGQNLGARQEERARQGVRLTLLYCLLVTVPTALAFVLIPDRLVALFTTDPGVIEDGSLYLRIIAFAQIGQSFEIVLEGALAGAGYTLWPMLVGTVFTALRIPLAAWWSGPLGLFGIWLALSLTAISRGIANTVFWLRGSWRWTNV